MATILEAQKKMEEFFKKDLKKRGTIKEVSKSSQGWKGLFEALEENELLKQKGFPVTDRISYKIELDEGLNTVGYGPYTGESQEEGE